MDRTRQSFVDENVWRNSHRSRPLRSNRIGAGCANPTIGDTSFDCPRRTDYQSPWYAPRETGSCVYPGKGTRSIIPVGIVGGTPDFLDRALKGEKPMIKMEIGLPYHLPYERVAHLPKKQAYQALSDYVLAKVAAMLPEEYRGYYCEYECFIKKL